MSETLGSAVLVLSTDDSQLKKGLSDAKKNAKKVGASMRKVGKGMTAALTLPIVGLGAAILKSAADFEAGMNQVAALTGATGDDFKALEEQAKELGATTQFSAGQAADAMGFLAQAGLKTEQIIGTLPATLDLAAASQVGLAETADMMTNIMQGFGLEADQSRRAADVLTGAFTNSNTNLTELAEAMSFAGPVLKGFGIRFEEAAAAVGLLGNAGIKASRAGTALSGALVRLSNPAKEIADLMSDLGINVVGTDGKMKSLVDIIEQLETSGASTAQIMKIFGQRAGPAMAALVTQGSEALAKMTATLDESGGKAKEIADVQMEGLKGQLKALKSALEAVALSIAETGLLEFVTDMARSAAEWLRELAKLNPAILKWSAILAGVLAVAGPLLIVLGSLATVIAAISAPVWLAIGAFVAWGVILTVFRDEFLAVFDAILDAANTWWGSLLLWVFNPLLGTINLIINAWNLLTGLFAEPLPEIQLPTTQGERDLADNSGFSDDPFRDTQSILGGGELSQQQSSRPPIVVNVEDDALLSGRQVRGIVDQINQEMADDSTGQDIQVL